MSTKLTIKDYTDVDADALAILLSDLYRHEGREATIRAQQVNEMMTHHAVKMRCATAHYDAELVGCIFYYQGYDIYSMTHGAHIADLVVAEDYRRRAIGAGLLAYVSHEVQHTGGAWMSLTCAKENISANKFYTALGFQDVSVHFYAIGMQGMQRLVARVPQLS